MGTRNLTVIHSNGTDKVAQYGQWDGYPDAAGKRILTTLKLIIDSKQLDTLKKNVEKCFFLTEDEVDELYENVLGKTDKWITVEQANLFKKVHPQIDRDMGYHIVDFIFYYDGDSLALVNNRDFGKDGLFCEYAYVVDLDNNELRFFAGAPYSDDGEERPADLTLGFDDIENNEVDALVEKMNSVGEDE